MMSTTVEAIPGSEPPSTTTAAASRSSSGTSESLAGAGSPRRLALVIASPPTASASAATSGASSGTRTPIRPGVDPHRWANLPPGFGTISVTGPGRSSAPLASRPAPSAAVSAATDPKTTAVGCSAGRSFTS